MEKLTEFDMAEYLDTEELQKGYLDYNAKEGTPEDLLRAINAVARARGMTETAKEQGLHGRVCIRHFPRMEILHSQPFGTFSTLSAIHSRLHR